MPAPRKPGNRAAHEMIPSYQLSNSCSRPGATRRATVTVTGSWLGGSAGSLRLDTGEISFAQRRTATGLFLPAGDHGSMPEGDTVWLAARRMHDALAGEVLTRTDFRVPRL